VISRTHDLAAFAALALIVVVEPIRSITLSTLLLGLLANQIGGIVPDIDQPTAPLWRNLPIGGPIGRVVDRLLGGHRFITHSLFGLVIFGVLARLLLNFLSSLLGHTDTGLVWWAFMIGMLSHLIMDSFTKEGVPWLLPIPIKFGFPPLKKFRVTTGHKAEQYIVFPVLLLLLIWLISSHYGHLVMALQAVQG
jgi:inner membrane protein